MIEKILIDNNMMYYKYDNKEKQHFEKVIKRAMIACENSGHNVLDDFAEVSKIATTQ